MMHRSIARALPARWRERPLLAKVGGAGSSWGCDIHRAPRRAHVVCAHTACPRLGRVPGCPNQAICAESMPKG